MTFSKALKKLKKGKFLTRHFWFDINTFVYLVPKSLFTADSRLGITDAFIGGPVVYEDYLAIKKTTLEAGSPWTPSSQDLLADDWCVVTAKEVLNENTFSSK